MAKSLQKIEDFYIRQGLKGDALRNALDKDEDFQSALAEKKQQIGNKFGINKEEEKRYLLPLETDYAILSKIKELETKELSDEDSRVVRIIKAQLEEEWRKPLIEELNQLLEKYS